MVAPRPTSLNFLDKPGTVVWTCPGCVAGFSDNSAISGFWDTIIVTRWPGLASHLTLPIAFGSPHLNWWTNQPSDFVSDFFQKKRKCQLINILGEVKLSPLIVDLWEGRPLVWKLWCLVSPIWSTDVSQPWLTMLIWAKMEGTPSHWTQNFLIFEQWSERHVYICVHNIARSVSPWRQY